MIYHMLSFLQQLSIPKSSVNSTPTNLVDFEVSTAGLSVTDPQKRLFSRKNFGVKYITYVVRIRYIVHLYKYLHPYMYMPRIVRTQILIWDKKSVVISEVKSVHVYLQQQRVSGILISKCSESLSLCHILLPK